MSNAKKILSQYGMMLALTGLMHECNPNMLSEIYEPKETPEQRQIRLDKAKIKRYQSQGLKEFFYGEHSLWALNKKSADRKAKNKHWL
jgi:hypothetical protein